MCAAGCAAVERASDADSAQQRTYLEREAAAVGASFDVAQENVPMAPQASSAPSVAPAEQHGPLTGSLSSRLHTRWTGDDTDIDLYEVLSLDYFDPARPSLSAHVMGRASADLDGHDNDPGFVFGSLEDTYDHAVNGKLYHAYVDIDPEDAPASLRIGRQVDYLTPEFAFFDGVRVQTDERGEHALRAGVYGGIPVHLYESSPEGDAIYGVFGEARPWKGGRARFDWMHLEDENLLGAHNNDLLGLGLWHALRTMTFEAQYTNLEQENRDLRLAAQMRAADSDLFVRVNYYELFEPQKDLALEVDPFTTALQEYQPFRRAGFVLSKSIAAHASLEGGIDARWVTDDGDVGEFNRDWERYYLTGVITDAFVAGLALSLTADQWDGDDRDIGSWGFDATREFGQGWKVSAGTYYALYKYDLYLNTEHDDVRTYYLGARWKQSEQWSFDLTYDFEDDDYDEYHVVRWGAVCNF